MVTEMTGLGMSTESIQTGWTLTRAKKPVSQPFTSGTEGTVKFSRQLSWQSAPTRVTTTSTQKNSVNLTLERVLESKRCSAEFSLQEISATVRLKQSRCVNSTISPCMKPSKNLAAAQ